MPARRFFTVLALVLGALSILAPTSAPVRAAASPRVLAFYYDWFDANTWSPNLVSDLPSPTYNSNDPGAIARHIAQAQSAGIDGFVVSWIGPNNPTDWNFKTLLGRAQSVGFQATLDFEVQHFGTPDAVMSALSYVRDTYLSHPAFMREAGKPVLFFWREQNLSVGDWSAIRQQVDPNHEQVWIAEGVDISYQQVFDGHHLYSIAWSGNPAATLSDWATRVRRAGSDKLWVATVMPGYDDTRTDRSDRFARTRSSGDFYRRTWQAAIASRPDWVIITSFNEWLEGSQIEPSVSYGSLYLDLTRQFAAQFKSGAPAQVAPAAARPISTPDTRAVTEETSLKLKVNQRMTTDMLRVRAAPSSESPILGRLKPNRPVEILARSLDGRWLQIAYPDAGHTGWVSSEFVAPRAGLEWLPILLGSEAGGAEDWCRALGDLRDAAPLAC